MTMTRNVDVTAHVALLGIHNIGLTKKELLKLLENMLVRIYMSVEKDLKKFYKLTLVNNGTNLTS